MAISKRWIWKAGLSVLFVSLLGGYFISGQRFSRDELIETFIRFGPKALILCFSAVALQNFFMALRIWALFPPGHRISLFSAVQGVFFGQTVNTFIPARAGDVLKAVIFSKASHPGTSSGKSSEILAAAGVIVADKLIDIAALLLLIFLSGAHHFSSAPFALPLPPAGLWGLLLFLIFLLFLVHHFSKGWFSKIKEWWVNFRAGLAGVLSPSRAGLALFFGLVAWSCEAMALKILCAAQNFPVSADQAVFLLLVLNLMIAIPIAFANLGPFEAALVFGLGQLGANSVISVAIAATHHGIQMIALLMITAAVALAKWIIPSNSSRDQASEFRVQSTDKKKAIDYFESVSSSYHETVSKGLLRIPRDRERAAVLNFAALNTPGTSLIDVGCGAGFYSLLAKEAGLKVHSVDLSPGMVKRLEGKVDRAEVADIENLKVPSRYDRVVCAGVLDFVTNPEIAFLNLCDLLAPGGRLVVLCPRKGLGGLFYRVEKFFFGIHVNLYTKDWFSHLAEKRGLKLQDYAHPLPTNMALLFTHQSPKI